MMICLVFGCVVPLAWGQDQSGDADGSLAKPIPKNRQEILTALEALKHRRPRLPLPSLTEAELEAAKSTSNNALPGQPGSLGVVNNGRMRALYLPPALQSGRSRGNQNSDALIPYDFATEIFWIVSRVNNCHYCLGHQEAKLESVGIDESQRLSLDTDWSRFNERQRAAFQFARKLTMAPHELQDDDLANLKEHFSDSEIVELTFLIGRYNATNRWTDSLGIPQEDHREFTSQLEESRGSLPSIVAVSETPSRVSKESFDDWQKSFQMHSKRKPRIDYKRLQKSDFNPSLPLHLELLVNVASAGQEWVSQIENAQTEGQLSPLLRNKIAYVAARLDRAWYMQSIARKRLLEQGMNEQDVFRLVHHLKTADGGQAKDRDDLALAFAAKLTSQPQLITDKDVDDLLKQFSTHEVAEIVYHVGLAAMLDRLTEGVGLGYEA